IHTGVEHRLDPGFDAADAIRTAQPDLVGISLHWHHQLAPVSALLEGLAGQARNPPVVLGGMTASAFAEELLAAWQAATFVIRGEADGPLIELADALERRGPDRPDLAGIPNLSWRDGREVRSNPLTFIADSERLDGIRFCRRDLVRHGERYNAQFGEQRGGFTHAPVFYLTIGRGCSVDCAFCSGGSSGHRRFAGREGVVFRSPGAVIEDMRQAIEAGHQTLCVCFDPPPRSEVYQIDLFDQVRRAGLRPAMVFECYRPPSEAFLEAFARTFEPNGSRLSFSPTVEDEGLRRELLGSPYSNRRMEEALAACRV
ncbi:MAG: B12-binding domain-containing radical SAM protein, partial [Anaerolineae bacterium]